MVSSPPILRCSGTAFDPAASAGDCYWDPVAAQKPLDFFSECLRHTKGPLAGQPFRLQPWQADATSTLFGWRRPDGTRRFRQAYITVPRKNGKTTWSAGLANFVLLCDNEARAENYCAGADREQAGLAFATAAAMVRANPDLASHCRLIDSQHRILYKGSFLRAIPANEEASHGFDINLLIGDELHAWPNRKMYDVLLTGMGARPQPLAIFITTAGYDRNSICWKEYQYACGVRDGRVDDPYYLPVIYETADVDDWKEPATWRKSNPNYGISVREDYFVRECKRAQEEQSYENTFRRLHLNQWTSQETRWIRIEDWRRCDTTTAEIPRGSMVWGGLDLSSTTDLSAWCLVRKLDSGGYQARWKFWLPQGRIATLERRDRVPYSAWVKAGLITAIPGERIDQQLIENQIIEDSKRYRLRYLGYDPYEAGGITVRLEQMGIECVKMRQTHASLNEPSQEFEACVLSGTLDHGRNKVMDWQAEHVEVVRSPSGEEIKPIKAGPSLKIDGIVAAVMAIGVQLHSAPARRSVYEDRGPLTV